MCYVIYISTTSPQNLDQLPNDRYIFKRLEGADDESVGKSLQHPNKWFLSSRYGGCSCHYRHQDYSEHGPHFGPPEDWWPEDEDDIESTAAVYDVLAGLVKEGHAVEVLDIWSGEDPEDTDSIPVLLAQVPRESFRFTEGYRYELRP